MEREILRRWQLLWFSLMLLCCFGVRTTLPVVASAFAAGQDKEILNECGWLCPGTDVRAGSDGRVTFVERNHGLVGPSAQTR